MSQSPSAADIDVRDPAQLSAALRNHPPTQQQRAVIVSPLEPLLVVAGAGSGKTATMADRVVWLVANGLARPEEILGVTFTRKAAGELAARLRNHLAALRGTGLGALAGEDAGDLGMDPSVSTYHSFAHTLVAEHGMRLGLEPDAPLWGPAQCWQLATRVVDAYDGPHEDLGARSTLIDAVLNYAGQAAEHLVDPADTIEWLQERADRIEELPFGATARSKNPIDLIGTLRARAIVARLAGDYAQAKAKRGVMDYGDLVAFAARLAERPEVAAAYRSRYKVVLLDEFQDTSHAQIELFARLFADGRHAVTAVGDPNQSIYGFRGASAGQLAAFRDRFTLSLPGGETRPAGHLELTTAWRNDVALLAAANAVSAPISGRLPGLEGRGAAAPEPAAEVPDDAAQPQARELAPRVVTLPRPARLGVPELTPRPDATPGRLVLARLESTEEEAEALAEFLLVEREAFRAADRHGAWPSVAVLTRKRASMEPIAQALRERGIPVEIVGLGGLLATPEVQDVVATLRALSDPGRSDALLRLLAGARWRIGPADLMVLSDFAEFRARRRAWAAAHLVAADFDTPDGARPEDRGHADGPEVIEKPSLIEALENLPSRSWTSSAGRTLGEAAHARLSALRDELRRLRLLTGEELPLLVSEIVRTLGLDVELAAKPGLEPQAARRHLDAFADVVAHFDGGDDAPDITTFLEWLEAASEKEGGLPTVPEPATDGTVQILTVHASKGLEWDIVAVPAMNTGTFPSSRVTRWTSGSTELPWPFRGDRHELPQFTALEDPSAVAEHQAELRDLEEGKKDAKTKEVIEGYRHEVARHAEREERRLAYVALTRGRGLLWCSSTRFNGTNKEPVAPSVFFEDLLPLLESQDGEPLAVRGPWTETEESPDTNPAAGEALRGEWPYDPLAGPIITRGEREPEAPAFSRRAAMEAAAADVAELRAQLLAGAGIPQPRSADGEEWDREARALLAERADAAKPVALLPPAHVRASLFVEAADNHEAVEQDLRRPVPHRPGVAARQGTVFHAWVEEHYGRVGMFDLDDEEFFADVAAVDGPVLDGLREKFLASEWAQRQPVFVEAPVETRIGPVSVRGRIDAVFRTADGRWDLVDWKTGRVPNPTELPKKALQLAVYRLAWSRLKNIPLESIDAAFYYVADGRTVRPERLDDAEALEAIISGLFDAAQAPGGGS
ncbi:ATP-dependent helicase [Galactobacter valiniphilus]|uniref:DNA 3'-5' helicase n=1 Tax=Galactobacter valiniphilus TaxID=2676122 RepID=A0A399JAJ7_9MICC|nr:ATP-dependent DNA helicase [Galactobacter valiniphilus]RII42593.1 ATP-dependent helicase [Galactobacter valiniphilus]